MSTPPPTVDVHTPRSSFVIIHSFNDESLQQLCDKLTRKTRTEFRNKRIGPGWIKYFWNDTIWNLDDDNDYTIFVWRQKSVPKTTSNTSVDNQITLHVHDPSGQLPESSEYRNPAFYLFQSSRVAPPSLLHVADSGNPRKIKGRQRSDPGTDETSVAKHRRDFEKFHGENGVRIVEGSIGPVDNVRMLLKKGYRHVYMSRKFAQKHGFIPADATPGNYGYGGLVNMGKWPIALKVSEPLLSPGGAFTSVYPGPWRSTTEDMSRSHKSKTISIPVYLSEETHFDVVLGRSFFDCRQIKTSAVDPTEVTCLDTGEKIACELVVLKDGKGEIVLVT
ncbi:hypothetical protein V8B97DRAFT_1865876 [Scleroderma yunnanense]